MFEMRPTDYLAPRQLEVVPDTIRRVQLIGGCLFDNWPYALRDIHPADRLDTRMFDHASPGLPHAECDLRIAQVPLRTLFSDWATMPLGIEDEAPYLRLLESARSTIGHFVATLMADAADVPVLLLNYLVPQQNMFGRFFPRYDLRNPIFLIESVNRLLDELVSAYPTAHVLDSDRVAASYGRRFIQDDPFWVISHNGLINDVDWHLDKDRLEPEAPLSERFDHDIHGFVRALWGEAMAMRRTMRGTDRIKMVCVDLDDTLWRGVMAEQGQADFGAVEGWPIGMAEALSVLGKRGVILALVSKNDPAFVADVFPKLFGPRLPLETFPIRKIGWRPKAETLREAIAEANVLPEAVLFVDDNPVERAQALEALPGLRVLGAPHLDWRRILLWSPELQVPSLTTEALRRNDMIAAQVRREDARASAPAGDFFTGLGVTAGFGTIASSDHPRFARALELLNKTNQFNTTGQRWTLAEAEGYFETNGRWTFAVAGDRFSQYGLVALALVRDDRIDQMVMSCRVFGLGIEHALIAEIARGADTRSLSGRLGTTERNGPCQSVFASLGWVQDGDVWIANETPAMPAHIAASHL